LKIQADKREAVELRLSASAPQIRAEAQQMGLDNFSLWGVEDLLCGYGEWAGEGKLPGLPPSLTQAVAGDGELLCAPGTMRLMYHDIGIVRADKSLIRHRVFVTKLKPGCEEEYKRRHDGLIAARGDAVSEGPDSNFTIWCGAGYIFGYCEKVKSFDREMTPEEKESTIDWETRQLEIMDWLTDDVDWITGQKHPHIRRIV
jgi:L-rhamnose mutarotase